MGLKNHQPTFKQFNEEINDFYKYLIENKYDDAQIQRILSPILSPPIKIRNYILFAVFLGVIGCVFCIASSSETIQWHLSAIGRIFMIKLLPVWDWTKLKDEKCLISSPWAAPAAAPAAAAAAAIDYAPNCEMCENLSEIDFHVDVAPEYLEERYLNVDNPVIVRLNWPPVDDLVARVAAEAPLAHSTPCQLATNVVRRRHATVAQLIRSAQLFDSFFVHFENCEPEAMRTFRQFAPRPDFVPAELAPVKRNWMLWSKHYNISTYKRLDLSLRVAVFGQIEGSNYLKLVAVECRTTCPDVHVKLNKGEALVLTSLWDLEYRPGEEGENFAAILELR